MGQNNEDSNLLADDKLFEDDDDLSESLLHPQQRNAANARERARMRVLSRAFCRLKTTLPWVPPDTKLSKLDTLRLATSYIAHLRAVLKLSENEPTKHTSRQPANMNWPFTFNSSWEKLSTTRNDDLTTKLQRNGHDECRDSQRQVNLFYGTRGKRRTIEKADGDRNTKIRRKRNANYQQRPQFNQQSYIDGEIISYNPQNNCYYKPYSMY